MLGPWTLADPGFKYSGSSALEFGGYLYQFGGRSTSGSQDATECFIHSAKILENGSLAPAVNCGAPFEARGACWLARTGQHVFAIGGAIAQSNSPLTTRFKLERGGGISPPTAMPPLPFITSASSGQLVPSRGDWFYFANLINLDGPSLGSLWSCRITVDGMTNLQESALSPPVLLPDQWIGGVGLLYGDNFMVVGGSGNPGNTLSGGIWTCKVNGSDAKAWRLVGALPGLSNACAVIVDNKLIVAGGFVSGVHQSSVRMASIDVDGSIGPFSVLSSLVTPIAFAGMLATKEYVYVVSGSTTGNVRTNKVQYAKILRGP